MLLKHAQIALGLSVLMVAGIGVAEAQYYEYDNDIDVDTRYGDLEGDVEYEVMDGRLWGDAHVQDITLQPEDSRGQFSIDDLGINDRVVINLTNPTDQPIRFQTTQRLGEEIMVVVPPNSTRTVSFIHNKPLSDEVMFMTFTEPGATVAVTDYPPVQAYPITETVVETEPVYVQPAEPVVETEEAVRGYW